MTAVPEETFLAKMKRLKAEQEALERGVAHWARADIDAGAAEVDAGSPRGQAWVRAKVAAQLAELAERPEGDRNDFLNNVAYSMGRLTPKWLDYSEIGNQLYAAARACGLEHDESVATIRSGLDGGMKDPRDPPVSDEPQTAADIFDAATGEVLEVVEEAPVPETSDDIPTPPTVHEQMVARELAILRARRTAQRLVVQEEMAAQFRVPPYRRTLTEELALNDEPVRYAITDILPEGANALLTAQYKTGKTTTVNDLIRAYADSTPFLGQFEVRPGRGRIAIFNYELSEQQYRAWLRDQGIQNTDAVSVLHLRGYRLPLTVPAVEDWIVGWLKEHDIRFWVADPLARAAVGTDEDSNTEMGVWLDTFDVIKERAGVSEAVLPNHTGRMLQEEGAERGRGATRVDDWADVRWILTKDDSGNRFFRATGRDVEVPEQKLSYDPASRRLSLGGGDRQWVKRRTLQDAVLGYVLLNPGCTAGDIEMGVTGANKEVGAARKSLVASHEIREDRSGKGFRYYPPGASSPSSP